MKTYNYELSRELLQRTLRSRNTKSELEPSINERIQFFDRLLELNPDLENKVCGVISCLQTSIQSPLVEEAEKLLCAWLGSKTKSLDQEIACANNLERIINSCTSNSLQLDFGQNSKYVLEEIDTRLQLEEAGRIFSNSCLHNDKEAVTRYLKKIQKKIVEIYFLKKREDLFALIEVNRQRDEINSIYFRDDSRNYGHGHPLSCSLGIEILRRLKVTANEIEEFVAVGAFPEFLTELPPVDPIESGNQQFRVWRFPEAAIIATLAPSDQGIWQWSRFVKNSNGRSFFDDDRNTWDECHGSSLKLGDLIQLLIDFPEVGNKLAQIIESNQD